MLLITLTDPSAETDTNTPTPTQAMSKTSLSYKINIPNGTSRIRATSPDSSRLSFVPIKRSQRTTEQAVFVAIEGRLELDPSSSIRHRPRKSLEVARRSGRRWIRRAGRS
ncbi:hypothetical protein Bca4012_070367 [Brassica carinata]|uniref:Uncharacterized protein n=1 Tax=Brassica carinata TaxID=52824 RepID=A0A8X7QD74_BRACI|nr:hypothetical protein Bca52824_062612 [Brassica carinata]